MFYFDMVCKGYCRGGYDRIEEFDNVYIKEMGQWGKANNFINQKDFTDMWGDSCIEIVSASREGKHGHRQDIASKEFFDVLQIGIFGHKRMSCGKFLSFLLACAGTGGYPPSNDLEFAVQMARDRYEKLWEGETSETEDGEGDDLKSDYRSCDEPSSSEYDSDGYYSDDEW